MTTQTAEPELVTRDITARVIQLRGDSINEQERSVEAVFATQDAVRVMDMRTYQPIDEVLRMDGAVLPSNVPMLDNHYRWSLDDVLGSGRQASVQGDSVIGRLYFAENDDRADKAWGKVKGKHISSVSAGYRTTEYTDIPAGQRQTIKGVNYQAKDVTLRVATGWELREISLVAIGADLRSKIRGEAPSPGTRLLPTVLNQLIDQLASQTYSRSDLLDDLAAAAGTERSSVDRLLSGDTSLLTRAQLASFAGVLAIETDQLLDAAAEDKLQLS